MGQGPARAVVDGLLVRARAQKSATLGPLGEYEAHEGADAGDGHRSEIPEANGAAMDAGARKDQEPTPLHTRSNGVLVVGLTWMRRGGWS